MRYEIIAYSTTRLTCYINANSVEEAVRLWELGLDEETSQYSQPTPYEIDEVNEAPQDSPHKAYGDYIESMMNGEHND